MPATKLLAPIGHLFQHNRYTRLKGFPSLYLSDGITTVQAEVFGAKAVRRGPLGPPSESRLTLPVMVDLPDVVDLTDAAILGALAVSEDDLIEEFVPLQRDALGRFPGYELPQCLGELANDLGIGAFLCSSAPSRAVGSGGKNLVIFTDHLVARRGRYEVEDPVTGELERWPQ